jgi:hypothetical protein
LEKFCIAEATILIDVEELYQIEAICLVKLVSVGLSKEFQQV